MSTTWIPYDAALLADQPLPPAKRMLLVQIAPRTVDNIGMPAAVAVGYLRFAAGDRDSPTWTIPGIGGDVVAWCDCIPDGFAPPLWKWKQESAHV